MLYITGKVTNEVESTFSIHVFFSYALVPNLKTLMHVFQLHRIKNEVTGGLTDISNIFKKAEGLKVTQLLPPTLEQVLKTIERLKC